VIDLELTWQEAAGAAGILAAATAALRRSRRPRVARFATGTQETALIFGLFALWQFVGSLSLVGPRGALSRGRWLWHAERVIGLPSETALQHAFLPHPLVIQAFNLYYLSLHFPVLIAVFTWLFIWHRDRYRRLRTTLVLFTGASLLIQFIPVAPPRMLRETGLVDTAVLYHQSVYQNSAGFDADELSAMPSVHVGWAILVAIAVILTLRTRWRWLALLYPAMTTLVVVVTANHYWLDGIVAAAVLGLAFGVQAVTRAALARAANSGLYPERRAWHDPGDSNPGSNRGPNGSIGTGADDSRAPAERDRSA
jgi:hypothetical protein